MNFHQLIFLTKFKDFNSSHNIHLQTCFGPDSQLEIYFVLHWSYMC